MKRSIKQKFFMVDYIIGGLGIFFASFIMYPILIFGFGYIGGMILNWVVGDKLIAGFNLLFNTTRFTQDLIPIICATLATIGHYFKSSQSN